MEAEKNNTLENEIDLIALIQKVWSQKKFILKRSVIFLFVGYFIVITTPVEYEATSKVITESDEDLSSLGNLAGLAGLIGVKSKGGKGSSRSLSVMGPTLYPEIVESVPFILDILQDSIVYEDLGKKLTTYDYLRDHLQPSLFSNIKKYTIGLPKVLFGKSAERQPRSSPSAGIHRLTKEENRIISNFRNRVELNMQDKTGVLLITVTMPDPYAAAQLAALLEKKITQNVVEYKTEKAKANLAYVEKNYGEAKERFENIQYKFAQGVDRNKNVSSATAEIELLRLKDEYNIAYGLYKGLATQVEQAKIQLSEQTPVFTILEPAIVPHGKSEPNTKFVLTLFVVLGAFITIIQILFTELFGKAETV